jgi:hypothetical protein
MSARHIDSREAVRMSACAKEHRHIDSREAVRMSACAKEQNRKTRVFHI